MDEEAHSDPRGSALRWRLAQQLLDASPAQPGAALASLCREMCDAIDGQRWSWVIAARQPYSDRKRGQMPPVGVWLPVHVEFDPRTTPALLEATERFARNDTYSQDPVTRSVVAEAGRTRVHISSVLYANFPDAPVLKLFAQLGVRDRITGAVPLAPDREFYVLVDRARGALFDEATARLVESALPVLRRAAHRLCLHRGWLEGTESLTERERETLRYLLEGEKEADCAERLGLQASSTHQIVVRIFRKLGVSSRAELMARCLGTIEPSDEFSDA